MIEDLKHNEERWLMFLSLVDERKIMPKTVLLAEGEVSDAIHFIKKGSLRQWFNKDGKDITFQFYFEEQAVASIDSFKNNEPSMFTIESIEPTIVLSLSKSNYRKMTEAYPDLKDDFLELLFQRFINYTKLFLSRIKDTPEERYKELMERYPEIIRRVPQQYIASYLDITTVSLSRIRNEK